MMSIRIEMDSSESIELEQNRLGLLCSGFFRGLSVDPTF